jgi:hypothetical protein
MSFDKSYENRKDWRQKYHKSKAFDRTCRPGGSCPYCQSGRKHKRRIADVSAQEQVRESLQLATGTRARGASHPG